MKDRGKAVETYNNGFFSDYSCSSDLPCKKHPQSSSVGICAYCLKDRLVKLVCSDCGEQRLSSCSCSEIEISSNRNSGAVEVGSVGRMSFLIENERNDIQLPNSKPRSHEKAEEEDRVVLKRSSSSCVEIRKSGFWRIGRLFRKKREKNCGGDDQKSEMWMFDYNNNGVSRSRSLCSFRGGGFYGTYYGSEDGEHLPVSAARSSISAARSSVSAARSSGVNGGLVIDPDRKSGFSELSEPRRSGFEGEKKDNVLPVLEPENGAGFGGGNRRVFSLKESDFTGAEDSGFIDLKFDFSTESKSEISAVKMGNFSDSSSAFGSMRGGDYGGHHEKSGGGMLQDGVLIRKGGSCRITVNEKEVRKGRKSFKGWRWIFRHHPSWRKKDEDLVFNPSCIA